MATAPGISGISIYVPRLRVDLERWCEWTGNPWPKVASVVGHGFRVCGPGENAYTMAASAVLSLIDAHDVDPRDVGMLALGTESSTDNAAGAVIVKGMVNEALRARGQAPIGRACEVPEFKHACLGGVYAMKAAARWLATDGRGQRAIVVSSDIAEYAPGSSGEQTQGAGAVAMLLDTEPTMLELLLDRAGASSDYRGVDFRKPFARHFMGSAAAEAIAHPESAPVVAMRDYPVFNGKYSTVCYTEAVATALDGLFARCEGPGFAYLDQLAAVFCHRPYQHMPLAGLAWAVAASLVRAGETDGAASRGPLAELDLDALCAAAEISADAAAAELGATEDLFAHARDRGVDADPYPSVSALARALRKSEGFRRFAADKLELGDASVREFGNLYTASLPAWMAAGLEDAANRGLEIAGRELLLLGYGSGDAAEAIPARVMPGWRSAASRTGVATALANPVELDEATYRQLHVARPMDGHPVAGLAAADARHPHAFFVDRVGRRDEPGYADVGIEYYRPPAR